MEGGRGRERERERWDIFLKKISRASTEAPAFGCLDTQRHSPYIANTWAPLQYQKFHLLPIKGNVYLEGSKGILNHIFTLITPKQVREQL